MIGITLAATALPADEFPAGMRRYLAPSFGTAAAVTLAVGAARPTPIVLVTAISVVLLLVWLIVFVFYLALGGDPEIDEL